MKKGKLARYLRDDGFEEPIFKLYNNDISDQNCRMVQTTSFLGCLIMLILTVSALFVKSVSKVFPLYLGMVIAFGIIYAAVKFIRNKSNAFVLVCNYAFLSAAFFFALGLDVIQKNPTATTVCVLLVALPLLVIDKPYREFLFFFAASVCFMLESVYLKQSPKASVDVLNSLSFLFIGTFLGYKHNQMMIRNIRGHHLLKNERDTDSLTNLYNKGAFEALVTEYIKQNKRPSGMLIVDMDNFKYVNDTYGHQAGDEILAKIGGLLTSQLRGSDYICRFGGDEFVAFLPDFSDRDALARKAEKILAEAQQLRITADEGYRFSFCMGIAVYPHDADSYEQLFKNADDAMYNVKKNGKNSYGFYDSESNIKRKILVVDDVELNRAVLKVILEDEFTVLEASDGNSALEVLGESNDVIMIITDIQMQGMNGVELIQRIRSDEKYHGVAIIANTQYGDTEQENEVLRLGADDFVYKATSPSVIKNRVKNVLRAKEL